MRSRIAFIFGLICIVVPLFGANGYQMIEQNLEEMTKHANIIITGKCEGVTIETIYPEAAPSGITVSRWRFHPIREVLKGSAPDPFIFDTYGVSRQEALKTGKPYAVGFYEFEPGKEYVVFLTGPTKLGVYAVQGMTKGVFEYVEKDGKATVVNKFSKSVFKGMGKNTAGGKAMKAANISVSKPPEGPIPYDDLKNFVNVLQSK